MYLYAWTLCFLLIFVTNVTKIYARKRNVHHTALKFNKVNFRATVYKFHNIKIESDPITDYKV